MLDYQMYDLTDKKFNKAMNFNNQDLMVVKVGMFGELHSCRVIYTNENVIDEFDDYINS